MAFVHVNFAVHTISRMDRFTLSGVTAIPRDITISTARPTANFPVGGNDHIQAIANTAAFHFGMIEAGGTSLYASIIGLIAALHFAPLTSNESDLVKVAESSIRSFARALPNRDITVPTGHFRTLAIS